MTVVNQESRLHGFDALRAIAMLLGIVLHASIAYKTVPLPNWPHDKQFNYLSLDFLYEFIHSFRMPLFYVIAGYFSHLILQKSGSLVFIKKRLERIGIPFLVSLFTILPFSIFPFLFNFHAQVNPENIEHIFRESFKSLLSWNGLAHLWFLYYLLIFYGIILVVRQFKFPSIVSLRMSNFFLLFCLILFTWGLLLFESGLYIQVDTGLIPEIRFILYYFIFFVTGYFIEARKIPFEKMKEKMVLFLSISFILFLFLFYIDLFQSDWYTVVWRKYLVKMLTSIQIVLLVFGIIGFFLRFYTKENAFWKYISDASYWMYLVHLGIVGGMQVVLSYTSFPGMLRFPLILLFTFFISLGSYQLFVRYSIIGKYLHGTRRK